MQDYHAYPHLVIKLLPFQGADKRKHNIPRVSLPVVACPGLGDAALSGRSVDMCVHYTQGVAPYGRLP